MKRDVTEEMRQEILRAYEAGGPAPAKALGVEMGLCAHYYSALAHRRGVSKKRSKPLTAEQKAAMRRSIPIDDSGDKRWQWAIERGPVVAP
jgi:Ni,Fe-hydrogenase III small subunit